MQDTPTSSTPPVPPPPGYMQPRRRTRWWIPLVIIGGLLVLVIVVTGVFLSIIFGGLSTFSELGSKKDDTPLKDKTVLVVDLSNGVVEYRPPLVFNFGGDNAGTSLMDIVQAIRAAKSDNKISGILYRSGPEAVGMTKLTELRDAMLDFKSSGKFVYAFIESGSKRHYYLASVADSIFMPQEGLLEFKAFGATGLFFKKLSDNIGISWHVEQFEEYKSAAEALSRERWSEPAKQELRVLIEDWNKTFVDAVAQGRHLDRSVVMQALDRGVFIPDSLLTAGLIDGFAREWELRERIHRRMNSDDTTKHPKLRTISISAYNDKRDSDEDKIDEDHGIAIVYASGAISSGKNSDPFESSGIYSKSLISDLRKAEKNDEVDIIILRIDSPGGSALASDEIWAAIQDIRKTKPIYASMSDVAASGGYYIAVGCDTIIAHPSTITGSIGVIMAIPNISGTLGKVGITTDTFSLGKSSTFMNTLIPFDDASKTKLKEFGGGIYHRFVSKVAAARKKSFEETRALAKGRVWTGADALKNGLVDVNGGLLESIKLAKKRIGVDASTKVKIHVYPEKIDNLSAILKMFGINTDDEADEESEHVPLMKSFAKLAPALSPISEIWKTLPQSARDDVEHTVRLTEIGQREHVLMMLPAHITIE
ncbi:MAG: signal peptide peptidase SppA [Ignavibacteria bacterium]|nr:signal peptide peptidase SppA [Ignavibacteria bacterium]